MRLCELVSVPETQMVKTYQCSSWRHQRLLDTSIITSLGSTRTFAGHIGTQTLSQKSIHSLLVLQAALLMARSEARLGSRRPGRLDAALEDAQAALHAAQQAQELRAPSQTGVPAGAPTTSAAAASVAIVLCAAATRQVGLLTAV